MQHSSTATSSAAARSDTTPRPLIQGFLRALEPHGAASETPSPEALMQALDALAAAHRGDREIVTVCRKWRSRLATLRLRRVATERRVQAATRRRTPRLAVA